MRENRNFKRLVILTIAAFMILSAVTVTVNAATGDDCTDPIVVNIPGSLDYYTSDTTCGRFDDYFNTDLDYYDGGEDIIYRLDVTATTDIEVTVTSTYTYIGVGLFNDCPSVVGSMVASDTGYSGPWSFTYTVNPGTYYLMVDSWPSPTCVDFDLAIELDAGPGPGEDCTTAIPVSPGYYSCPGAEYWYQYTATCDGQATVTSDVPGAFVDTYLYIYDDCLGTLIDFNDDKSGYIHYLFASEVTFPITTGEDYYIFWDDTYSTIPFDWQLSEICGCDVGVSAIVHPTNGDGPGAITPEVAVSEYVGSGTSCDVYLEIFEGPLGAEVINEDFEGSFPPAGWSVVNYGGTCVWNRNDFWPETNYCNGVYSADANSDSCGSGSTMDTGLITPAFSLAGTTAPVLEYECAYNYLGSTGEAAEVDISIDGGSNWINLQQLTADVGAYGSVLQTLDLSPYAGEANCQIRFHYIAPGWDWWWQVDDVHVYQPGATTPVYSSSVMGFTAPGYVTFSPDWTPSASGLYSVRAWTEAACDTVPGNDLLEASNLMIGDIDAGVDMIVPQALMGPVAMTPEGDVTNYGDIDLPACPVHCWIDSVPTMVFSEDFESVSGFNQPDVRGVTFDDENPKTPEQAVKIEWEERSGIGAVSDWTILNYGDTDSLWHQTTNNYVSPTHSMQAADPLTGLAGDGDDWLISPPIMVEDKAGYIEVELWKQYYESAGGYHRVFIGNSADGSSFYGSWYYYEPDEMWNTIVQPLYDTHIASDGTTYVGFLFRASYSGYEGAYVDDVKVYSGGNSVYDETITVSVDALDNVDAIFPPFTPLPNKDYTAYMCTEQPYDEDFSNDCDGPLSFNTGAPVYILENGLGFPTIQDGIDAAEDGQTVVATDGTYNENLVIDKPITVTGENIQSTLDKATCTYEHNHGSYIVGTVEITGTTGTAPPAPCTCDYEICLYDDFGDGWNGGYLDVYVDGILVLPGITVGSGYGPECYTFTVESGLNIEIQYTPGSYAYENNFDLFDSEGNLIVGLWYPYYDGTWTGTATCPPCSSGLGPSTILENFDITPGYTFTGHEAAVMVYGENVIVRQNTIHNVLGLVDSSTGSFTIKGIHIYGGPNNAGSNILIENNTIRDILNENVTSSGGGTTVYFEDFDSYPEPYTFDGTATVGFWDQENYGTACGSTYHYAEVENYKSHSAPNSAEIYYNCPNDDWLVSPVISLAGSVNTELNFWYLWDDSWDIEFNVYVKDTSVGTWDFLKNYVLPGTSPETWYEDTIPLGLYDGADIQIAFQYVSDNEWGCYIDDVLITSNAGPTGPTYGGATGVMVQGYLSDVTVMDNRLEDVHSAGWCYGVEVTPTASTSFDSFAPVDFYLEDFTTCPGSWTTTDPSGDGTWFCSSTQPSWTITPMGSVAGTFMMIDDDSNDGNNNAEELISPVINCANYENIYLDYDGCFNSVFTGTPYPSSDYLNVEVYDGSAWQQVGTFPTYDDDIGFGATGPYDVSTYADGNADFQIKFTFNDYASWAWGALIDNVKLTGEETGGGPGPGGPVPTNVVVNCNYFRGIGDSSVYDVWADPASAPYPGVMFTVDTYGIIAADPTEITLKCNYFDPECYNDIYAVINKDLRSPLDATHNYWGRVDGPSDDPINPGVTDPMTGYMANGRGCSILNYGQVMFDPWLGVHANIYMPMVDTITVEVGEPVQFDAEGSFGFCFPTCEDCCDPSEQDLQFLWDFGDGTFSANKVHTHIFQQAGEYEVSLMVDTFGFPYHRNFMYDWDYVTVEVIEAGQPLDGSGDGEDLGGYEGTIGEPIQLYGSATGGEAPYSFVWDLGNGETAREQNPVVVYKQPGTYTITVTITDWMGTQVTDTVEVTVYDTEELIVNMNGKTSVAQGDSISFTSTVTGGQAPYNYNWNFGDGITSNEAKPTHVFETSGTYTVTLTVSDSMGNEKTKSKTVTVTATDISEIEINNVKGGLLLKATVVSEEAVQWTIDVEGKVFFGGSASGTAQGVTQIKLPFTLGLGKVDITVTAGSQQEQYTAFMLGPFVLNVQEA